MPSRPRARPFLTGRNLAPVEVVAKEIVAAGGSAEAAKVDAVDEQAIDEQLQSVIDVAGRVDTTFNAVGIQDTNIVGAPLVELDVEQFSLPIKVYTTAHFLTARLAARRMVANKSGAIMTVTALPSRTGTVPPPSPGRVPPGTLDLSIHRRGAVIELGLSGELDIATALRLGEAMAWLRISRAPRRPL